MYRPTIYLIDLDEMKVQKSVDVYNQICVDKTWCEHRDN